MNMSAMKILLKHKRAQHSVHPNPGSVRRDWRDGSLRVFKPFS